MKFARNLSLAILVLAGTVLTGHLVLSAGKMTALQVDLAELNDVKYGLLDAELWINQVSIIVNKRIDEFELTPENRPVLKARIEAILQRLLREVETYLGAQRRREQSDVGRALRRLADRIREILIPFDQLQSGVPDYADAILEELNRPDAKNEIKRLMMSGIQAAADSTFTRTDRSRLDAIVERYQCESLADCRGKLQQTIDEELTLIEREMLACVAIAFITFLVATVRSPVLHRGAMLGLTCTLVFLLVGGVATPMIGIEARISELNLEVLGEPVVFRDQILYFQSKSVLGVVSVLATTGELDMLLVAILIGMFSVLFPVAKVLAGFAYYYDVGRARALPWVRFFALYSSKWSMADVMVVAIFMAFIGFRGLISSQLDDFADTTRPLEILTTNGTSLQVGFFLFLSFCLGGLWFASLLQRRSPPERAVIGSDAAIQTMKEPPDSEPPGDPESTGAG